MGWVGVWNDEHQGRSVAAIAVSDIADDDTHEIVDRYAETTTGYCAARVHDTDLQAAMVYGTGTKDLLFDGETVGNIVLPAGVRTVCIPWTDVTRYLYLSWHVYSVGGNPVTEQWPFFAPYANGTGGAWLSNAVAVAVAGATISQDQVGNTGGGWVYSRSTHATFRGFRLDLVSNLGGTARCALCGWRF